MMIELKKKRFEKVEIKIKKIGMLWKYHNYGILKNKTFGMSWKKHRNKKRNGMLWKEIIIEKKTLVC